MFWLERGDFPNPEATSFGTSRIFRFAYPEGQQYVPLLERSLAAWQTLDAETGGGLCHRIGSLTVGPADGESLEAAQATCRAHDIDYELLGAAAVTDRFSVYQLPEGYRAFYQPDGCLLDSERCLTALANAALDAGARLRGGSRDGRRCTRSGDRALTHGCPGIELSVTSNAYRNVVVCNDEDGHHPYSGRRRGGTR